MNKKTNNLIIIPKIEKYMLRILLKLPRTEKFSIGTEIKIVKYIKKMKKKKDTIYVICTDLELDNKTINKTIHARWE